MKSTRSVLVIYEASEARETAVAFCDRLIERFWAKCGFDVSWSAYEALQDEPPAKEAARKAAEADLILFAHSPKCEPPPHIRAWTEMWLQQRGEREGLLVALTSLEPEEPHAACPSQSYLRHIALRAGMDFATGLPESIEDPIPDSPEVYNNRAGQVTRVLDGILHRPSPTRW